jgi:ABC-type amino acid transport substrate-binding protein
MTSKIIAICLILSSLISQAQTTELKLGSDTWPPFTNVAGEKSFALDLVQEALERINIKSETEIVIFEDVLSAIDKGELDGSAALWSSPERSEKYYFSEPYLYNQLILVGRKGSVVKELTVADLAGKKVGIVEHYAYGEISNPQSGVIVVESKSDQKSLEKLLTKQIEYLLVDKLLIQYMLKYQINDVTKYLEFGDTPLMIKSLHFALSKNITDGSQIVDVFNKEIKKMIADGSYNDILELNWIKSDIDGDGKYELVLQGNHAGLEKPTDTYSIYAEKTFTKPVNNSYRYIIDGQSYDGWENIPDKYKIKVSPGQANPNNIGLIFSF